MKNILIVCIIAVILCYFAIHGIYSNPPEFKKDNSFFYCYPITNVHRVYDGDTFWLSWTMGFDVKFENVKCRLLGADTFEKYEKYGKEATVFTKDFLSTGPLLLLTKGERGNFGRPLVDVINVRNSKVLSKELYKNKLLTGRYYEEK